MGISDIRHGVNPHRSPRRYQLLFSSSRHTAAMSMQHLSTHLKLPALGVWSLPPSDPRTAILQNTERHSTLGVPFKLNHDLLDLTLDVRFPITVAVVYMAAIAFLNGVNRRRYNKPWKFSQTYFFRMLVILHNSLLAIFSAWAFIGMCQAVWRSWPAWGDPNYGAHMARAMCQTDISIEPPGEILLVIEYRMCVGY